MIRNSMKIKLEHQNTLISSDQIMVSVIDAVIVIVSFLISLAFILNEHSKIVLVAGLVSMSLTYAYIILKNVFFRSIGCIMMKGFYDQEPGNERVPLWFRILIHNGVSVFPFIGLVFYERSPYVFYLIIFIYILNFIGYITDSRRIIDSLLRISIIRGKRKARSG